MRPRAAHCCGRGARQFAEIGYEVGLPALSYSFDRGFLQGRHWARIGAADDTGAEGVCVPGGPRRSPWWLGWLGGQIGLQHVLVANGIIDRGSNYLHAWSKAVLAKMQKVDFSMRGVSTLKQGRESCRCE